MVKYRNIIKRKNYLNQLAKAHEVTYYKRSESEIIDELVKNGHKEKLDYLEDQFKFSSSHLTLCQLEEFWPEHTSSPEKLLSYLIKKGVINSTNIDTEWQPELRERPQLCAIKHEGSAVFLKFVEKKTGVRKSGYSSTISVYAQFTSFVIVYGEEPHIQMRCPFKEIKKYMEFLLTFIGFGKPCKYFTVPKLTKKNAAKICEYLSAGVASRHIILPATVGSVLFHGTKGTDLSTDNTYEEINNAIKKLGLPTDDTADEKCIFKYKDTKTSIEIETTFEVQYKKGYFKFLKEVPECVVDHVLDTLILVDLEDRKKVCQNQLLLLKNNN